MGKFRRKHSREFKIEAVKQVVEQGRSVAEVSDGLGINRAMLARWKMELESEAGQAFRGHGKLTASEEEVRELRRKLSIAEQERDILKKAVAFFAKTKS